MSKKIRLNLIWMMLFAALTTILLVSSPQAPGVYRSSFTDSSVFRYIGKSMTMGIMPYRDIYDHKGILLYIINMLGYIISPAHGIWVLEWMFLFTAMGISAYGCYKLVKNMWVAGVITLVSYGTLSHFLCGGNLTEEYSLPFIALALLLFTEYFLNQEIPLWKVGIIGACFGWAVLLRPNQIGVWVACCFIVFIKLLFQKKILELGKYMGCFLAGTFMAILPFVLYMIKHGIVKEFYEWCFAFNFRYAGGGSNPANLWNAMISIFSGSGILPLGVVAFGCFVFSYKKKDTLAYRILTVYIVIYCINMMFCVMSGYGFEHYGISQIPVVCGLFAALIRQLENWLQEIPYKMAVVTGMATMLGAMLLLPAIPRVQVAVENYIDFTKKDAVDSMLVYAVRNATAPTDRICVLGNSCNIYLEADRIACSKYIFQNEFVLWEERLLTGFAEELMASLPRAIIVEKSDSFITEQVWSYIEEYVTTYYRVDYEDENYILYVI